MVRYNVIPMIVLVAFASCSRANTPVHPTDVRGVHTLSVGQVWAYRARPGEQGSTLTIGKLEEASTGGSVVHISLAGLHLKNPGVPGGYSSELPHAPFTKVAIDQSVTELIRQGVPPPAFEQGYQQWQQSNGGVFTISVAEAVDLVEKGINK
jgi:hypothetical protein